jgi:hypothetical protein
MVKNVCSAKWTKLIYSCSSRHNKYHRIWEAVKLVSIAEARKDEYNDFIPDYKVTGDTLMVTGVVFSPNYTLPSNTLTISMKYRGDKCG